MFGRAGRLVNLVPLDKEKHLENVYRWLNDPEVTEGMKIGTLPLSRQAEADWFDQMSASKTDAVFAIETLDGRHIGTSGIHQISYFHGTCSTGSFIGEVSLRGKGFGTDMALTRAAYCFDVLNMRLLKSCHRTNNIASARMQEKCGYEVYGELKEAIWIEGKYHDMTYRALTRERFRALHPNRLRS